MRILLAALAIGIAIGVATAMLHFFPGRSAAAPADTQRAHLIREARKATRDLLADWAMANFEPEAQACKRVPGWQAKVDHLSAVIRQLRTAGVADLRQQDDGVRAGLVAMSSRCQADGF